VTTPESEPVGEGTPDVADPRVADALRRLEELADRPTSEHVEVYEDVHRTLQDVLADASRRDDDPTAKGSDPDSAGDAGS
jgi:hypothetical protein